MLTFYYLDENRPFDFDVDEKKITRLREKIKSLVEQISKSDFRATPGYHCRSCDYYEICPFRKANDIFAVIPEWSLTETSQPSTFVLEYTRK